MVACPSTSRYFVSLPLLLSHTPFLAYVVKWFLILFYLSLVFSCFVTWQVEWTSQHRICPWSTSWAAKSKKKKKKAKQICSLTFLLLNIHQKRAWINLNTRSTRWVKFFVWFGNVAKVSAFHSMRERKFISEKAIKKIYFENLKPIMDQPNARLAFFNC